MIYVIWGFEADENKNPIKAIKIGYTNNFEVRFAEHKVSHPTLEVLFKIEDGTMEDEHSIHRYLKDYAITHISNREWFQYCDEVIEFFEKNPTIEDIRKVVPRAANSKSLQIPHRWIKILVNVIFGLLGKNDYEAYKDLVEKIENIGLRDEEALKVYLSNTYGFGEEVISGIIKKIKLSDESLSDSAKDFINEYVKKRVEVSSIFKSFCELSEEIRIEVIDYIPYYCRYFYTRFGPERCKALGYRYSSMTKECKIKDFDTDIITELIYSNFNVGERMTLVDIKRILKEEYSKLNYDRTAKATDILNWFEVRDCTLTVAGKKCRGFELLKKKK